jgi:hypothetical protein
MNLLMGEDKEEGISLESQKATCQQNSDVTIMYKKQAFCSANNKHTCGIPPDASHVSQSIASGRHAFAISVGVLEESHDHSASN